MMSAEHLESFLKSAASNQDLKAKTQAASSIEELVAIAEQAGFSFSSDDFKSIELDDNDLASISGGYKLDELIGAAGSQDPSGKITIDLNKAWNFTLDKAAEDASRMG